MREQEYKSRPCAGQSPLAPESARAAFAVPAGALDPRPGTETGKNPASCDCKKFKFRSLAPVSRSGRESAHGTRFLPEDQQPAGHPRLEHTAW